MKEVREDMKCKSKTNYRGMICTRKALQAPGISTSEAGFPLSEIRPEGSNSMWDSHVGIPHCDRGCHMGIPFLQNAREWLPGAPTVYIQPRYTYIHAGKEGGGLDRVLHTSGICVGYGWESHNIDELNQPTSTTSTYVYMVQ